MNQQPISQRPSDTLNLVIMGHPFRWCPLVHGNDAEHAIAVGRGDLLQFPVVDAEHIRVGPNVLVERILGSLLVGPHDTDMRAHFGGENEHLWDESAKQNLPLFIGLVVEVSREQIVPFEDGRHGFLRGLGVSLSGGVR